MDNAATIPPDIVQLSGPLIVGYLLHWGLFGTLSMQLYLYYRAFPNDRKPIQYLVYTVYLLELVQTILMTHDAFTNFGTGFGNTNTLRGVHFDWLTIPIMSGIVACIGQTFYAYRVYLLSKAWYIPMLIVTEVSLISAVSGILNGSFSREVGVIPRPHTRNNSVIPALWLGGAALDDFIIAVSVTYYLLKNDTGLRRTHMLVVKLIRLTIETGSLTAAVTLINLALFFAFPGQPYFFAAGAVLPKLYANTIFAILNSRLQILGGRGFSEDMTTHQSVVVNIRAGGTARTLPPLVTITREIYPDSQLEELEMKDPRGSRISGSGQS